MSTTLPHLGQKTLSLQQPRSLVFGSGCAAQCLDELVRFGLHRIGLISTPPVQKHAQSLQATIAEQGMQCFINDTLASEPTLTDCQAILEQARTQAIDAVVGLGGGSVLDVAKLVAALLHSEQTIEDVIGIGRLQDRKTHLTCIPTTAGTGSEVSPNAILLDEKDRLKKGAISPYLIPDAAFVDPDLTMSVPPDVTAATGLDALTHCIEAYANRFAHPMTDLYALKGIELISKHLETAYRHGDNQDAREALALGSLYGGLCLGPVNTGAIHALAYPLGGTYKVPHGASNALLLPAVLSFNLTAAPDRYAQIALAMGCEAGATDLETAQNGVEHLRHLAQCCGNLSTLSQWGVPKNAIETLAESALTVTRLLKNNPRTVTLADAIDIYQSVFE